MKLFGVLNQVQHDNIDRNGVEMLNQVQHDNIDRNRVEMLNQVQHDKNDEDGVEMLNQVQYDKRRKAYPPTRLTSCPISFRRVISCSR
jgi:hypothetical protein